MTMTECADENVEHPKHYADKNAPCECIEVIHYVAKDLPGDVAIGIGNATKYLWRLGKKNPDSEKGQTVREKILQDMRKAAWYLCDAISQMEVYTNKESAEQKIREDFGLPKWENETV
jgi:hypothetical protein